MRGGDKIDTIRQEVENLLHNKKRYDVFGKEEQRMDFLQQKKELLYSQSPKRRREQGEEPRSSRKVKFYEGYQT